MSKRGDNKHNKDKNKYQDGLPKIQRTDRTINRRSRTRQTLNKLVGSVDPNDLEDIDLDDDVNEV
jgi:hypothetical protein